VQDVGDASWQGKADSTTWNVAQQGSMLDKLERW
jgi:hypothetical protein